MGAFVFAILLIIVGIFALTFSNRLRAKPQQTRLIGLVSVIAGIVFLIGSMVVVIDAGEVGAVVIFGKVKPDPLPNGLHLVPPYAMIVKYPVRLREFSMEDNNAIEAKVTNGLNVIMDITTLYYVDAKMISYIYGSVAPSIELLEYNILLPIIRTIVRDEVAVYLAEEIYSSKRTEVTKKIEDKLKDELANKGIIVDKFMIRKIDLPSQIDKAIQEKLTAQQEAEAMEYRKLKAQKEAEIKIIEAQGLAQAQKIINSTLTPSYLQHEAIQAYKDLANSPNSTFIIMPTSTEAAGLPIILNAQK